jgi:hypothetical protein
VYISNSSIDVWEPVSPVWDRTTDLYINDQRITGFNKHVLTASDAVLMPSYDNNNNMGVAITSPKTSSETMGKIFITRMFKYENPIFKPGWDAVRNQWAMGANNHSWAAQGAWDDAIKMYLKQPITKILPYDKTGPINVARWLCIAKDNKLRINMSLAELIWLELKDAGNVLDFAVLKNKDVLIIRTDGSLYKYSGTINRLYDNITGVGWVKVNGPRNALKVFQLFDCIALIDKDGSLHTSTDNLYSWKRVDGTQGKVADIIQTVGYPEKYIIVVK